MNIIPWRRTQNVPVTRREPATDTASRAGSLAAFRSEMDRLLEGFVRGSWLEPAAAWSRSGDWPSAFVPTVDVTEGPRRITIRAEVPGIDPSDIEVSVSGSMLTIQGRKEESTEDREDDRFHCERRFGSFTRTIELPEAADLDAIEAEQHHGVLTIRVPRQAEAAPRKVEVNGHRPAKAGTGRRG